ncbi:hypothetical protein SAMN05216174_101369 [Actinokineospora iranica]|uniref:Uncharacterized protein n=1 Tax=Actinokineospora iranica TaxID=1271860 RepID=A0A1G6JEH4_9PSEU|nr:hypothetical protein SAMN05216174_101369 [Actinokineospora iranica]
MVPVDARGGPGQGGALVLRLTGDTITEAGTLTHPRRTGADSGIRRSLVAGGALWTLSASGLLATDLDPLRPVAWVPFA